MIDLATEGIRGAALTRSDVVRAVRQVMMSAHRNDWSYADTHALLTDQKRRRLAKQIATGRGDRPISAGMVGKFLAKQWDETAEVVAQRPAWTSDDAIAFVEHVRDTLDRAELPEQHRAVMAVVVDLAAQHGTTRPAVPVRTVEERTGLPRSTAHRVLGRLAEDGEWLALAKAGNARTRRANLYNLAPALAGTYAGASPPRSHPPMSHPPMSHPEETPMDGIMLSREAIVEALGEAAYAELVKAQRQPEQTRRHLTAVQDAEVASA